MERPKPTKQLMIELTGGNQGLLSSIYNGLYETPLNEFYPHLDLDEAIAFAASSWKSREQNTYAFQKAINSNNIYNIFKEVYKIGFPWLNTYKNISEGLTQKHNKLNPFKKQNLEERLNQIPQTAVEKLKQELQEGVNEYVFECNYQNRKRARWGDNYKLKILGFQSVYPKKGKIVPAYASQIAKMLSRYDSSYNSFEEKTTTTTTSQEPKTEIGEQLTLF